jgi:hypothetical protein
VNIPTARTLYFDLISVCAVLLQLVVGVEFKRAESHTERLSSG